MEIAKHVHAKLVKIGIIAVTDGDVVKINLEGKIINIKFDAELEDAFAKYKSARSISYDNTKRILICNNSVEMQVISLSGYFQENYKLSDVLENSVVIGSASSMFLFSYFDSDLYDDYFKNKIVAKLLRTSLTNRKFNQIVPNFYTAIYIQKGRKTPTDLIERAYSSIERSLFKIAVEQSDCYAIWKPKQNHIISYLANTDEPSSIIPIVNYDESAVSYYKVAKASPFPSQSFLAYYHVLEYYFLRVSESLLRDRLSSLINSTSFQTENRQIDQVISIVRGQDSRNDETEMLRSVIHKYIDEKELLEYIETIEKRCGEKIYTKKRKLFGEEIQINNIKEHVIPNTAKTLKHIRNAIVHSSDRYNRDECHIPLSPSEDIIEEYVPLIRYLAEKTIYGNAK